WAILILVLVFPSRLEIAAAVWGILAFGDGTATLAGRILGRRSLPWNRKKTWIGSLAFCGFGTVASSLLLSWTAPGVPLPFALGVCGATSLLAAAVESLPHGLDDNLGVPLVSGLFLSCLLWTRGRWVEHLSSPGMEEGLFWATGLIALLSVSAYGIRSVDASGAAGGFSVATTAWIGLGWEGFLVLGTFFALGTLFTRVGHRAKQARGIAQERDGRRTLRHVLSNGGVGTAAALFAATTELSAPFRLAFVGSLAAAMADTAASEIGKLSSRNPVLLTTARRVPPGTRGAISPLGTAAAILSSLVVAAMAAVTGILSWAAIIPVVVAALLATTTESLIGPVLEESGLVDSHGLNFLNSVTGALLAVVLGSPS
ncbi:MAG: DUF92 domain-containing protein, partial [Thermoanaerobaculia bacterium]|nr:DUF92 domain-containing protein [Thermoanaerobaculia bacterium]